MASVASARAAYAVDLVDGVLDPAAGQRQLLLIDAANSAIFVRRSSPRFLRMMSASVAAVIEGCLVASASPNICRIRKLIA